MAGATISGLSKIVEDLYLPAVREALNKESAFLYGSEIPTEPTFDKHCHRIDEMRWRADEDCFYADCDNNCRITGSAAAKLVENGGTNIYFPVMRKQRSDMGNRLEYGTEPAQFGRLYRVPTDTKGYRYVDVTKKEAKAQARKLEKQARRIRKAIA